MAYDFIYFRILNDGVAECITDFTNKELGMNCEDYEVRDALLQLRYSNRFSLMNFTKHINHRSCRGKNC